MKSSTELPSAEPRPTPPHQFTIRAVMIDVTLISVFFACIALAGPRRRRFVLLNTEN